MDPDAFYKLALAEIEAVHRLAFHLCRDRHTAEDLVQETYLRATCSFASFKPGEFGIRPWLFKILHNLLHTRRSRERRRQDVLKDYASQSMEQSGNAGRSAPIPTDWNADNLDARLSRAIQGLPIAHRTVFLLSAVEELKYREIAEIVGVPVGTVMSRLSRARVALSAQLDELASEKNLRRRKNNPDAQSSRKD